MDCFIRILLIKSVEVHLFIYFENTDLFYYFLNINYAYCYFYFYIQYVTPQSLIS